MMIYSFEAIVFLVLGILVDLSSSQMPAYFQNINDYTTHPCMRPCNNLTMPMMCTYQWVVEWYSTLSKACLDCPFNVTSCSNKDCIAANGVVRSLLVINRMMPGPQINVCQNDTISVTLYNNLHMSDAISIHWHGLLQKGYPHMDGVSMLTQCPINPHTSFEYRFVAQDAGTHMWHAHSGFQRADGVFGPIVIHEYEQNDPYNGFYDFDLPEHVITVIDWTNVSTLNKFTGHFHQDLDNKPSDILINGKGALRLLTSPNNATLTRYTPRATFTVEQGYVYRFRLINPGILYCPIQFSIDQHNLTIIASDGKPIEMVEVQSLIIYAGERYDFLLNASQPIQNYWIKTKGLADCSVFSCTQMAILNYAGLDPLSEPTTGYQSYANLVVPGLQLSPWNQVVNESNSDIYMQVSSLRAINTTRFAEDFYQKMSVSDDQVKKYYFAMEFNEINNPEFNNPYYYPLSEMSNLSRTSIYTPQINHISLMMPSIPPLFHWDKVPAQSICNHLEKNNLSCPNATAYCSCLYTLKFNVGDVVEMVFIDEGVTFQSNHPIHLHGEAFAVLGMGKLNTSTSLAAVMYQDQLGNLNRNLDRPSIKDTVTVPVGGYTIMRFPADNPGLWFLHCHLEFHSEIGMGLLIRIGNTTDLPNNGQEPNGWPQCGNYVYDGTSSAWRSAITLINPFRSLIVLILSYAVVVVISF